MPTHQEAKSDIAEYIIDSNNLVRQHSRLSKAHLVTTSGAMRRHSSLNFHPICISKATGW